MTDERIQQLLELEHAVLELNKAKRGLQQTQDYGYGDKMRAAIKHWTEKLEAHG